MDGPRAFRMLAGYERWMAEGIQTHHRGQVTTLLSQLGIDPVAGDVIAYYRQTVG